LIEVLGKEFDDALKDDNHFEIDSDVEIYDERDKDDHGNWESYYAELNFNSIELASFDRDIIAIIMDDILTEKGVIEQNLSEFYGLSPTISNSPKFLENTISSEQLKRIFESQEKVTSVNSKNAIFPFFTIYLFFTF
jgi:hypothetical protein